MKKFILSILVASATLFTPALHAETADDCVARVTLKSMGYAGLYGAGVMFIGTGAGILFAPAGAFTAGQAAGLLGLNTLTGGAIGVGSSAVTHLSLDAEFKGSAIRPACVAKVTKDAFLGGLGRFMD